MCYKLNKLKLFQITIKKLTGYLVTEPPYVDIYDLMTYIFVELYDIRRTAEILPQSSFDYRRSNKSFK